jgi:hypothetical protein
MQAGNREPAEMDDGARMAAARKRDQDLEKLGDQIAELSAHIDAATWRLLQLIREFDEREGWGNGFQSCAHWLNWRVGLGMGAARDKVRVARALAELPRTSEAFRRGQVSYSKVRALTRIATPATEEELLGIARAGTASHVESLVRGYRRADRAAETARAERRHDGRYLRTWTDENGMFAIEGRLSPEVGAAVAKAIELAEERLREDEREAVRSAELAAPVDEVQEPGNFTQTVNGTTQIDDSAESSGPPAYEVASRRPAETADPIVSIFQRRADALGFIAEAALAANLERGAGAERAMVVLHVDREVLADPTLDGRSELDDGHAIPPDTVRRIACDAALVAVTHGPDGGVLDVGRRSRSMPTRLRRALHARDGRCRFPGCTRTRYLEGHHVRHWADGGEMKISNLVYLCWYPHRAVHEGGFTLERANDGAIVFRNPFGLELASVALPPVLAGDAVESLFDAHRDDGLAIGPRDNLPGWMGERMDVGFAVEGLFNLEWHRLGRWRDVGPAPPRPDPIDPAAPDSRSANWSPDPSPSVNGSGQTDDSAESPPMA